VEALTGKLTAPGAGSRAGLSWLAGPAKSKPEVEEPELVEASTAVPPPPVTEVEELPVAPPMMERPAILPRLEERTEAEPQPVIPVPAEAVTEAADAPATIEPKAEMTMAVESGAEKPLAKEWLPLAAANVRSLGKMLQVTGACIGWTLTVQAGAFVAFCVLAAKDAPLSGLQQFLLGAIPVSAIILLCAGLANFHAAQLMLDKLEAERLGFQHLLTPLAKPPASVDAGTRPDSLTNLRRLAYWPPLVILGILLVVWLCLGLTVWFL